MTVFNIVLLMALVPGSGDAAAAEIADAAIPPEMAVTLGIDPEHPVSLNVVYQGEPATEAVRQRPGYDPSKDIVRVEFGHVAEDRYLWRTTFAAPPNLEDTVHHLYIDADDDPETGRQGYGVEYMLTVAGGSGRASHFSPEGDRVPPPRVRFAVRGNSLLTSADVQLGADQAGTRFRMWVLCHTVTTAEQPRPPMSDSTGRFDVHGVALHDRPKLMSPEDFTEHHRVQSTYGLDVLRPLLNDPANVIVPYDQLQMDGFEVDLFTSQRYGHLVRRQSGARAWHTVQQAGTYHVGFVMYDDGSNQRIAIHVGDDLAGVAVVNAGKRRHGVYFLDHARDLAAGDTVRFDAVGTSGKHGIAYVLLMPQAPEERGVEYRVEHTRSWSPIDAEGQAWISWTTRWPSTTRFEFGTTTDFGQVVSQDRERLVHRARLTDLTPGTTYYGRGVGTTRDGRHYYGPTITFGTESVTPPPTREGVTSVPLNVRNEHDIAARDWPVTGGVPFPQGVLASENHVRLLRDGVQVPAQIEARATWPDGSIKWLLIGLLVQVDAGQTAVYELQFGREVTVDHDRPSHQPLAVQHEDRIAIDTGALQMHVDVHGQLVGPQGPWVTELVDGRGTHFSGSRGQAEIAIVESGPIRSVIHTVGPLVDSDGEHSFRIKQRIEAWRGQPWVRVHHTFVNTVPDRKSRTTLETSQADQFCDIHRLSLLVPLNATSWSATREGEETLVLQTGQRVWQPFDDRIIHESDEAMEGRLLGGLLAQDGDLAISVRDFWQNYPKGFAITTDGVRVDLCPDFDAGRYDAFPFEEQGHQLYYYLRDGSYTFKRGMAKTHDLLIDFGPSGEQRAQLFQRPLLLTAQPAWYCDSGAFYRVAPRDPERFPAYEQAVDRNLQDFLARRERQRDYGLMNYGDWYGERQVNWGNVEYDTQHAFFLEYIRSGNPEAFFLGEAAQLHHRDIDTVHWCEQDRDVGLVYVHQMGHVGGYYDEPVPGTLGIPRAGGNIGHAWTEGHFGHYFLTGDRRSLETGLAVVDYFTDRELARPYDWTSARVPGWHLIMLASALAATNDPYYLNAARIVIDRVLETQDTEPRELPVYQQRPGRTHQRGGWTRMMVPGHCHCEPRHRGNAGFMVSILLTGMIYYHDVTQDPDVRQAIILGTRYMVDEFYCDQVHGFRYTSCPEMAYRPGLIPMYAEAMARVYLWTGDERFVDPLTNGLARRAGGSAYGKSFSQYYRSAPRLLADLSEAGFTLE